MTRPESMPGTPANKETTKVKNGLASDIVRFQREEATGARLYRSLSRVVREKNNSKVLADMAAAEEGHYAFWKKHSGGDQPPYRLRYLFHYVIARLLGLTFALKLMERGEEKAAGLRQGSLPRA